MLSTYSYEQLQTDVSKVWTLFFERQLILDIGNNTQTTKPYCKNFRWKYNKNGNYKSYIGYKEQNAMFPVVSRSYAHFGFPCPFVWFFLKKVGWDEITLTLQNLIAKTFDRNAIKMGITSPM